MESVQTAVRQGLDKGAHLQKMCMYVFKVTMLDILPHGRIFTTSTVATIDQLGIYCLPGSSIIAGVWCNFTQTFQELVDLYCHSDSQPRSWKLRMVKTPRPWPQGHWVESWDLSPRLADRDTHQLTPSFGVESSAGHFLNTLSALCNKCGNCTGGRPSKYYFLSVFLETYNLIFFSNIFHTFHKISWKLWFLFNKWQWPF